MNTSVVSHSNVTTVKSTDDHTACADASAGVVSVIPVFPVVPDAPYM
jgi:hypothetical protein